MKCPTCKGAELHRSHADHELHVGEMLFVATLVVRQCPDCGEQLTEAGVLGGFERRVSQWLADHGARTPDAFRFMRRSIGLRANELAELLDVTPETVSRWEKGKLAVEHRAFVLLGGLVADVIAGRSDTRTRLGARPPVSPPVAPVRITLVA
jgi:putative zinc finger/helix-turn-helix YgiT family protein